MTVQIAHNAQSDTSIASTSSLKRLFAGAKKVDKRALLSVAAVGLAVALDVTAGSDSTFTEIVTSLDGWMTGSLGKVFALGALGTGLAIGVVKQSVMAVVTGVAVALSASVGPGVLTNIFTATL